MKVAIPGEVLGSVEEFFPGEGVIEINGKVIATVFGKVEIDSNLKIHVKRIRAWPEIKEGIDVYGIVSDIIEDFVIVEIICVDKIERDVIGGEATAALHISKITRQYVDDIGKFYRIGDILRAKVIKAKPSIRLETIDKKYGVILARCTRCRRPLEYIHGKLYCLPCQRIETRKIAEDYRKVEWSRWKT